MVEGEKNLKPFFFYSSAGNFVKQKVMLVLMDGAVLMLSDIF